MPVNAERFGDLTEGEIYEYVLANPKIFNAVAAKDPRVILQEKLYGDPDAKKDIQKHSKRLFPKASIPEIDIPLLVKEELKEDVEAVKQLRAELEEDKKARRHNAFRAKLQEAGADAEDLDDIETFMVDNEIGPKSIRLAVDKFYETRDLAEPRGAGLSPDMPLDSQKDEHMKALLAAGPADDLDMVNMPHVEKVFQEMFGQTPGRRGR